MTIAKKIESLIAKQSWIRKMFEEGTRLKAEYGAQNVYDFSLGNPKLPPPEKFNEVLKDTVDYSAPGDHGYMPNIGYPQVCVAVAEYLSKEQQVSITQKEVLMTCGAAGGPNVIF